MPLRWTVSESGDHVNFLHFPVSGIVSLIYTLEDGSSSETALVGNEGLVGISIFMGGESMPTSTEVQSAGKAYRLSRAVMKRERKTMTESEFLDRAEQIFQHIQNVLDHAESDIEVTNKGPR